jgi:hypothetical protein
MSENYTDLNAWQKAMDLRPDTRSYLFSTGT